jgi:hypothetical protein
MRQLFLSKSSNPEVEVQIHDYQHNPLGLYARTPLKGFFSPSIRYAGQDRSGAHGHITTGQKYGARALPIRGFINSDSLTAFSQAVETLSNILTLEQDRYGRPIPMILRCVSDTGVEYTINVVLKEEPELPEEYMLSGEFYLPLQASAPLFRQLPKITSSQLTISQNLGALLPAWVPFRLGTVHGSQLNLYNNGNVPAPPLLTLVGQLTNPVIINNTTNEYFKLNYTLTSGQTATIDMEQSGEARLGNVASINNFRAAGSVAWSLAMGINNIALQTSNSSDDGYVQIDYYNLRTNLR